MKKNLVLGLFLGLFPGFGHMYIGRKRSILYLLGFIVPAILAIGMMLAFSDDGFLVILIVSAIVWMISFIDLIITWNSIFQKAAAVSLDEPDLTNSSNTSSHSQTVMLAFVPGAGHLHLGLMNRGLTFLAGFFGLTSMIFFVTVWTNQGGFLVFLFIMPIIWIYNMFDIMKLLKLKESGETLVDQSMFEDFEQLHKDGEKNKILATILAIFPGACHMYLGLQRRGLQLMIAFLFTIYILDILRIGLFLFLVPIIWFFSFFDALQQTNKPKEILEDKPVVEYIVNHQRWVGIGLVVIGLYYIFDRVIVPIMDRFAFRLFHIDSFYFYYTEYFQTGIVSFLLILGGIKLLKGTKKKMSGGKAI